MATAQHEAASAAVSVTPSAAAVGAAIIGVEPERWLTYCGIAFIALQAAYLIWKWQREARGKK